MKSFFKIEAFKSLKEVMETFLNIKNVKSRKKVMQPFFVIKNFKSHKKVMEFFLSFRNFKSRKKVTESFFCGHASLSFHMMHKLPGRIFSANSHWISLNTHFFLWLYLFDYTI